MVAAGRSAVFIWSICLLLSLVVPHVPRLQMSAVEWTDWPGLENLTKLSAVQELEGLLVSYVTLEVQKISEPAWTKSLAACFPCGGEG